MLIFVLFFIFSASISFSGAQDDRSGISHCRGRFFSCEGGRINFREVGYPFWGGGRPQECGFADMELRCSQDNETTIDLAGQSFAVLEIRNYSMRIARLDLRSGFCGERYESTRFPSGNLTYLQSTSNVENLCFFRSCSDFNASARSIFNCSGGGGVGYVLNEMVPDVPTGCRLNMTIPVMRSAATEFLRNETVRMEEVVSGGFEVEVVINGEGCKECERSGGVCRPGSSSAGVFVCSRSENSVDLGRKIGIGIGAAAGSAIIMCILFFAYHHRYRKHFAATSSFESKSHGISSSSSSLPKYMAKSGVHIFDYHELEEATAYFDPKMELGDGGFGAVYKGKLKDGRTVAVKRMYENHYRMVEQFLNEIKILTCLRHQNLVSLYGCTSVKMRDLLLVYEYIPNGTVSDHLHGSRAKPGSLSWITRLDIAVETASALSYLHASGVIHRDVKTTNILLDNNFIVKVADFGLSRFCPTDVTHVSTAPQGTPGYVDPEYNECYQLTEKSDVYSFGVVLMELVSSQPAVDITRNRREIKLSTMAINRIQSRKLHELVDPYIGFESDCKVHRMVIEVAELAFQCLQSESEMRPNMQDVYEILQGIQSRDCGADEAVVDVPADDILELKSGSQPVSPK